MIRNTPPVRTKYRCLLVVSALLTACTQPVLNSERIRQQYGSYYVEVLTSSADRRVSNLYTLEGEQKICRTFALVTFIDPRNAAIEDEQRQITAGASIGTVFKDHGWTIRKRNLHLGTIEAAGNAALIAGLMDISVPTELALHVYRFELHKGNERIDYAIIAEVHHPDCLTPTRLLDLYERSPQETISRTSLARIQANLTQLMRP